MVQSSMPFSTAIDLDDLLGCSTPLSGYLCYTVLDNWLALLSLVLRK